MAFQQTAYNNYDPRPMPVGTDLMARGGGYYSCCSCDGDCWGGGGRRRCSAI